MCFLPTSKTLDPIEKTKDRTEKSLPQTGLDLGFHSAQLCGIGAVPHGWVERFANLEYLINSTFWIEISGNIVHRLLPFEYLRTCPKSKMMKNSFNNNLTLNSNKSEYLFTQHQLHGSDPTPLSLPLLPFPPFHPFHRFHPFHPFHPCTS